MSQVAAAFNTYTAIGNREDLTSLMELISPLETPAYDRWGSTKATGRKHEWQTQELAAAAVNAFSEGATFTGVTRTPSVRHYNDCQVMVKAFSITDTQEIVDKAGRSSEVAFQRKNAMLELKRDMEYAIFASADTADVTGASGFTSVSPLMKSVDAWQVQVVGQTGSITSSGCNTAVTLTESAFNIEVQRAWNNGAKINTVYVAGALKRLISGWGVVASTRPRDGGQSVRLVNKVDFYLSDFGEFEIVLDRYVASNQLFLLDDTLWKKAFLVPTREKAIADTGLAANTMIWNQWTLEARNPTGNSMLWSKP